VYWSSSSMSSIGVGSVHLLFAIENACTFSLHLAIWRVDDWDCTASPSLSLLRLKQWTWSVTMVRSTVLIAITFRIVNID
jgi:hypothetical protein